MEQVGQLRLLLWKNYLLRVRHKGTLAINIFWPIAVFFTLLIIRWSVDPTNVPTCQYKPEALPSAGLLPFMQSYICSVSTECNTKEEYHGISMYKEAKLTSLLQDLQVILPNDTIIDLIQKIPMALKVFTVLDKALSNPQTVILLTVGIPIYKIFKSPEILKHEIVQDIGLDIKLIDMAFNGSIKTEHITELIKTPSVHNLTCENPEKLKRYLYFEDDVSLYKVLGSLCQLPSETFDKLTKKFIKNADISALLSMVLESSIAGQLQKAGISNDKTKDIFNNITRIFELFPIFQPMFGGLKNLMEANNTEINIKASNWLADAGTMLCGHPIVAVESNKIVDTVAKATDHRNPLTEIKALPKNCQALYSNITSIPNGKIIWSFMKPLIRGKIFYMPNNNKSKMIIEEANTTFHEIGNIRHIIHTVYSSLDILTSSPDFGKNLGFLFNLPGVKTVVSSSDISNIPFENIMSFVKGEEIKKIKQLTELLNNALSCVEVDRFHPVENEAELEKVAIENMRQSEFLAGLVFQKFNDAPDDEQIPSQVNYTIRMDIDSVPSTSRLRSQFWFPGPEDELENRRYFRGFVQLQDMLDRAITRVQRKKYIDLDEDLKVNDISSLGGSYTLQMPYPCWKRDPFQNGLHISQGLQVCFYFALMMAVAASVRYIVWERESSNVELMRVMGIKPYLNTFSWFITTMAEMILFIIIILIILKFGDLLPNSNYLLLFLYFTVFGLATVMFCYMIQTMFVSASMASVSSVFFYLLTFMPYVIIISMDVLLVTTVHVITHLSMSTSFCYGCLFITRLEAQGTGLTWEALGTQITPNGITIVESFYMLLLDSMLYGSIGCFIDYYKNTPRVTTEKPIDIHRDDAIKPNISSGVLLSNISKIYNKDKKNEKRALDNVSIALNFGHITTLLGENGAGKTTLIKILTGSIAQTSGRIISPYSSKHIGFCPQNNVLFDALTPKEHLEFYANLKCNFVKDSATEMIVRMINTLKLGKFQDFTVNNLSDGLRRRLCIAIAFIGSPHLVVLDEPSAGVDPMSRGGLWYLISELAKYDQKITVLLTTHHMDEAEIMSDKIVVLNKGKVIINDTVNALKEKYCFYEMTLTFNSNNLPEVHYAIPQDTITLAANTVLGCVKNAKLIESDGLYLRFLLPFTTTAGRQINFKNVIGFIEEQQENIGYSELSLRVGDMNDVFMALCSEETNFVKDGILPRRLSDMSLVSGLENAASGTFEDDLKKVLSPTLITSSNATTLKQCTALLGKRIRSTFRKWTMLVCIILLPAILQTIAMGFSLIRPPPDSENSIELYTKMNTGMQFISSYQNNNSKSIGKLIEKEVLYIDNINYGYRNYHRDNRECKCLNSHYQCTNLQIPDPGAEEAADIILDLLGESDEKSYDFFMTLPSPRETLHWIIKTHDIYIEKRYGGVHLEDLPDGKTASVIWYNNKGYHSLPANINLMSNAMLKALTRVTNSSTEFSIKTFSHPLKLSTEQLSRSTLLQYVADVGISLIIVIGFSLVPASCTMDIISERINHEKRLQYLSGITPIVYWSIQTFCGFLIFVVVLAETIVIFELFGIPIYIVRENLYGIAILSLLYWWSCANLMHILEKIFDGESLGNMILFCGNVFTAIFTLSTIVLMDVLGKTSEVEVCRNVLHHIFLILPQYALADGFIELSKNTVQAMLLERFDMDTYLSPFDFDLIGINYLSLACVGLILFCLNILIENHIFANVCELFTKLCDNHQFEDIEESDVRAEKNRVCHGIESYTDIIQVRNLRKVYKSVFRKPVVAVNDINFGVSLGQCFGLIGRNGSGKSTTFKLLTGELTPTSGIIELDSSYHGLGKISYCPQNHALDPVMTPLEILVFYGTIRKFLDPKETALCTLRHFNLLPFATVRVNKLSGGNKRKLNAAIAIMGHSRLIFMDESTSGMDPRIRTLLVKTIRKMTKANRTVFLTSHNMKDCEVACDRIALIDNGQLKAIGTPQHLQERYFSGYLVSVRLVKSEDLDRLEFSMASEFSHIQKLGHQYLTSKFLINSHEKLSELFKKMDRIAEMIIMLYSISLPTLDQVMISVCEDLSESATSNTSTMPVNAVSLKNLSEKQEAITIEEAEVTKF